MDASLNGYIQQANRITQWVWYQGTDALLEGEAVCYEVGVTSTAADREGKRLNYVTRPRLANSMAFAGVAARDYTAKSTGQLIEINCPGSMGVNVALGVAATLNTGLVTFTVGTAGEAGRFMSNGLLGRGTAVPRQTVSKIVAANMTGNGSLATDGKTLTHTSATAPAVQVGDSVYILSGANTGSDRYVAPGKYTVASVTSATVCVLDRSAAGDAAFGGAMACTVYIVSGNPKCQADLLTGDESGGVQFITALTTGTSDAHDGAITPSGTTMACGGITVGSENSAGALATPAVHGIRKRFYGLGTLTTNEFEATLTDAGLDVDHATALKRIQIDAAGEDITLQWNGLWMTVGLNGATTADS